MGSRENVIIERNWSASWKECLIKELGFNINLKYSYDSKMKINVD